MHARKLVYGNYPRYGFPLADYTNGELTDEFSFVSNSFLYSTSAIPNKDKYKCCLLINNSFTIIKINVQTF